MRFVVSSSELLSHLQAISRVISPKNTLPILDNYLFDLSGNELVMTASDLETTLVSKMVIENTEGDGKLAIPAKILNDTLKEFPEQPLTFDLDLEKYTVEIYSENGKFCIVGQDASEYPMLKALVEEQTVSFGVDSNILHVGVSKTIFATADDEIRPIMNGILFEINLDNMTFVASDAHKLVKYIRSDVQPGIEAKFVLPKKPAGLLKNILAKEDGEVIVKFDQKNAYFQLSRYTLVCRLAEGTYPNYQAVIPYDNPQHMIIDRAMFYNSLRRVSVFSNQASNLIKLKIENNQVYISAQDIDFSISAYEHLNCQYEGESMEIGFKSTFLVEILNNMSCSDVVLKLADPTRAGILVPQDKEIDGEDELMLIMPMSVYSM